MTKFVQRVLNSQGEERLYLRRKGWPRVRLHSPYGSPELDAEVKAALNSFAAPSLVTPGTLAEALRAYELEDANFKRLSEGTKYEYRLLMKELTDDFGPLPLKTFTPAYVLQLRNAWAGRGHRACQLRLLILKHALTPAMITGLLEQDPFARLPAVRRPSDAEEPHRIWPAVVVEKTISAALAEQRYGLARAIAIGRYVGARRGDLVRLTKAARVDGRFQFVSGKRRVQVDQAEDPRLTRLLDTTPATQPDEPRQGRKITAGSSPSVAMTLVYNLAGRPYSPDGLGLELRKLVADLHRTGVIDSPEYDLHGLRHTRGVEAALAGCTDAEGAALMGHNDPRSFVQYRRQAERIQLADGAAAKILRFAEQAPNGSENRRENQV